MVVTEHYKIFVTIVICTWNRAELLRQTLQGMCSLQVPDQTQWELLVVNNNSTDATDDVIASFVDRLPIRQLFEPQPGKSHAMNLAIKEAAGELILCTDDDAIVDPEWIAQYIQAAEQWPEAAFLGGRVDPWFAEEPPEWITRNWATFSKAYAIRQPPKDRKEIRSKTSDGLPFGVNMAIRKHAFSSVSFDERLGPCENNEIRGEESALLLELLHQGYFGIWVPDAVVRHYIPPGRLTRSFFISYYEGLGRATVIGGKQRPGMQILGIPRYLLRRYCIDKVTAFASEPFKGRQWAKAFRSAAKTRGIIRQLRDNAKHASEDSRSC